MKKRFTEEQIIGILKEAEAGAKVAELCRKHGISDATYYNWKAKFGGMTVSDAQRLKALDESPRGSRRLHCLREWSYEEATEVFSRSHRARRTHGQRGCQ